ncbi:protein translocase subunit SecD [Roseovarius atlanticus]|uniref:protein translocase subunit SecD n=1 Tax=Roseovarius atlanticus TaxID=1641875 RepID=UPI001C979387|nr:protein translocase subunit SecD [Roseovarius atlanticus]MBY5988356.1 protein translocase subunit SecD [Roseovarius atlanticus]MBY6123747.1 protein translocase subunit SecD [Roseovarius atlanticus]MBY6148242.1 protein translocase subunit SecD [Roseovarius atlanticus]
MLQIDLWKRVVIWGLVALGLLLAMPNAFYTRVETHNDATMALEMGGEGEGLQEQAEMWPDWLPSGLVNLGLDLRGGAHLLAEVQVEDVYEARIEAMWPEIRDLLREERDRVGPIRLQDTDAPELRVRLVENADEAEYAASLVRGLARPVASVTGAGQNDIAVNVEGDAIVVTLSEAERQASDEQTVRTAREIIERRINEMGTREPTIQRQGADRILIQVPGVGSAAELKDIIGTTAQLTFQPVVSRTTNGNETPGGGNEILPSVDEEGVFYILERAPVVTGEQLVDAQPDFDQNGRPAVSFRFNPTGARQFGDYTAENIGNPFAIVLDNEVISAPVIQGHIPGGTGIITGQFTVDESTNLAVLLRAGALPAELNFLEERTIGPELGADSIEAGQIACIVAFALVLVFMWASYGVFGLFANIALVINVGLMFGLLSLIGATLTLPGIAGIVLTIGMAVDANVLVFERIREEMKTAKGASRAIQLGYERALSAITDANITTFITALILYAMGSGPVRGFAITLGLGIITSVFTAIFVTRLIAVMWFERKRPKTVLQGRSLKLVPTFTNWDFFKRWKLSLGLSGFLIVIALGSFLLQGLNYGIDFRGGTTIRTQSTETVDVGQYRDAIAPLELGDISITEVFDPTFGPDRNVTMIRIQAQDDQEAVTQDTIAAVEGALQEAVPDITFTSVESVGPKVSGELIQTAVIAVLLAIAAVLIYIWLRFEWQFALGAVIALVHDVVLTIGIFSEVQIQFDLAIIAALLTIVGYSLNDTVVVFDRVRENLRKYKKKPLKEVLNISINETLSRTMMTSVTTLLALLALFALGGDVIRGFVFAMIWGVVVGTYSSIFVASTVLMWLGVKRDWSKPDANAGTQFANIDA